MINTAIDNACLLASMPIARLTAVMLPQNIILSAHIHVRRQKHVNYFYFNVFARIGRGNVIPSY